MTDSSHNREDRGRSGPSYLRPRDNSHVSWIIGGAQPPPPIMEARAP
ncbi:hypothetical protein A2U01_0087525, partial [Trifolium medium]|nr:hypothetical protein [Trifolium medium]